MGESLLGYDIRPGGETYVAARWDRRSRDVFLLNRDIAWPLSVDTTVWPSAFRYPRPDWARDPYPAGPMIKVTPDEFRHRLLELWQDRAAMIASFHDAGGAGSSIPVAVTLVTKAGLAPDDWWKILEGTASPPPPPPDWSLIGYDVATTPEPISGLSNCGYRDDERPELERLWSSRLSDHGLFVSADDAHAFVEIADRRVPEHAPFWVFGLYRASLSPMSDSLGGP